jgi:hypothetical protein
MTDADLPNNVQALDTIVSHGEGKEQDMLVVPEVVQEVQKQGWQK